MRGVMATPLEENKIAALHLLLHDLANGLTSLQLELELSDITGDINKDTYYTLVSQLSRVTGLISDGQSLLKELEDVERTED